MMAAAKWSSPSNDDFFFSNRTRIFAALGGIWDFSHTLDVSPTGQHPRPPPDEQHQCFQPCCRKIVARVTSELELLQMASLLFLTGGHQLPGNLIEGDIKRRQTAFGIRFTICKVICHGEVEQR